MYFRAVALTDIPLVFSIVTSNFQLFPLKSMGKGSRDNPDSFRKKNLNLLMDIYKLQWPTGQASSTPSANITQALKWLYFLSPLPFPLLPAQVDGPTRSWKELPGSTQSCLCMDTSCVSSCSKDLDEAWLTVVGGSSAWGISVPLYTKKKGKDHCA